MDAGLLQQTFIFIHSCFVVVTPSKDCRSPVEKRHQLFRIHPERLADQLPVSHDPGFVIGRF
jgi:hypothetical protein